MKKFKEHDSNIRLVKRLFSRFLLFVMLLGPSVPLHAQDAVAELNGEAGLQYSRTSYSVPFPVASAVSQVWDVSARLNVPVWSLIGASISLNGGRTSFDVDLESLGPDFDSPGFPQSFGCDQNLWSAGGALFVRDPQFGRVRSSYRQGRTPAECGFSSSSGEVSNHVTNYSYGLDAEYYFADWTLAAGLFREGSKDSYRDWMTNEELEYRFAINRYMLLLGYYPTNDWRLNAGVSRLGDPADMTNYSASIEYQPPSLANRVSGAVFYDRGQYANTVGLRLTVYFGAQPDLKTRDRFFR